MIIEKNVYYDVTKSSSDDMFTIGDSFYIDDEDDNIIIITDNKGNWNQYNKDEIPTDFEAVPNTDWTPVRLLNSQGITWIKGKIIDETDDC